LKKGWLIVFVLLGAMFSSLSAQGLYDKKYEGTYIPESLYDSVVKTNSYYEGIKASDKPDVYTVLSIGKQIFSNVKFHDSYVPEGTKFSFEEKSNTVILTDTKTNITYRRISDSTDYYDAYSDFLMDNCMASLKGNSIDYEIIKNPENASTVRIFGNEWFIDKDQYHYSEGIKLILYRKNYRPYIGIIEKDGKDCFYTLKNVEELKYVPDELFQPN